MTDLGLLDDYAVPTGPASLRIERLLPGPIERVWSYLTESDLRRRWLAEGEMELTEGAAFTLTWRHDQLVGSTGPRPQDAKDHSAECRIIVAEPPTKLSFEWPDTGIVTIVLASVGDQVRLTLSHDRAPNERTVRGVSAGWHAHLDVLAADLKGSPAEPFWDRLAALREEYSARLTA